MYRKMGRFKLNWDNNLDDIDLMIKIQENLAVLYINHDVYKSQLEFTAIGNMFKPVPTGQLIPLYNCIITREDNNITVTFEEVLYERTDIVF